MILRLLFSILLILALASPSWARIAAGTGAAATPNTGTTSIAVAYPSTINVGDLLAMCVVNKYPTDGPATPSGWTFPANGQASGGAGTPNVDDGPVYATWFYRVADGTETPSGTVTVSIPSGNAAAGQIIPYRNSTGTWSVAAANGAQNTDTTSWSVTASADPGIANLNDFMLVCAGAQSDAPAFSAEVMTQTGVTYGTMFEHRDVAVTDGDDFRFLFVSHPVASGASSAAPVWTATASGTTSGAVAFMRIRQEASAPIAWVTPGTVGSAVGGTATPAFPASITADDLLVLCVANKYPPNGPAVPIDAFGGTWSAVTNGQATCDTPASGCTGTGVGVGAVYATVFTKVATGSETGNLTVIAAGGNVITAIISQWRNTTGLWLASATNGSDTTTDTTYTVVGAADQGVAGGDVVVVCTGSNATSAAMTEASEVLTQTGVTYSLSVERNDSATTFGDDIGIKLVNFTALAGTSSDVPTFTTPLTSASTSGATVFLRLRQDVVAAGGGPLQQNQGFLPTVEP